MATQNKSLWLVLLLVVGGILIFFFTFKQNNTPTHKVVMQEIFNQNPQTTGTSIPGSQASGPVVEKDPVPSPAIVTSPEHGQEAGFAVQVYSFKDQKRAHTAVANLKNSGYNAAYIEISDLGEKGIWYRVRIGGLENEVQAKALLEDIRKSFNSGIIIKPKP